MNYQPNMTNPFMAQQQTYQYGAAYNQYAAPIGSVGYNSYNYNGYYNNYQYQSYDPLEIRKQLDLEEERRRNYYENNIAIRKRMIKCANSFDGYDTDMEALDSFFSEENLKSMYDEEHKYDHMIKIATLHHQQQQYRAQQQALYEQQRRQYIENCEEVKNQSLFEFLEETATEHYIEALQSRAKATNQNIGRLYNHDSFAELIHRHNQGKNNIFDPNVNVDDIEIQLPTHLQKDYDMRRAQFMQSITQNTRIPI